MYCFFFFQAEDGIRDSVTGVQTCALPISISPIRRGSSFPAARARTEAAVPPGTLPAASIASQAASSTASQGSYRRADRKSVVLGKRVDLGGRRIIKKKKKPSLPANNTYLL